MEVMGSLSILNVGAGDVTITFNPHDAGEAAKAIRMLQDCQRRGYAILVRLEDGTYARALDIDASRGLYIISETPALAVTELDTVANDQRLAVRRRLTKAGQPDKRYGKGLRRGRRGVPIRTSHAVGVARSAGG